jgi:ribosomal protein L7Ae-like RNA K-turn-binding protein
MAEKESITAVLSALGLCAKAGKLICGTPLICEALKAKKQIFLVVETSDNSENTQKRLRDRCAFYGVTKHRLNVDGETLARALGKNSRTSAVAITDEQLCRLVLGKLKEEHIL